MKIKDSNSYTLEELKEMDKETAIAEILKKVYGATALLELLEIHGRIHGNGHYLRQTVANKAKNLIKERWLK